MSPLVNSVHFTYDPKCSTTFPRCTINAPVAFASCAINAPVAFARCTNHFVHKVEFSYIGWNGLDPLCMWPSQIALVLTSIQSITCAVCIHIPSLYAIVQNNNILQIVQQSWLMVERKSDCALFKSKYPIPSKGAPVVWWLGAWALTGG